MLICYNLETDRGVAQLVEHWSPKPGVASSSLAAPAIFCARELSEKLDVFFQNYVIHYTFLSYDFKMIIALMIAITLDIIIIFFDFG